MARTRIPPPPVSSADKTIWNNWYVAVKDAINNLRNELTWTALNFTGSNLTDIITRNHNDLNNVQGGSAGQRYHLTSAEYAALGTFAVSGTEGQTMYNNAGSWTATSALYYDDVNGRYGIGTTSPSGWLHIKAGTATAGTAPLKFTSGTLNTTQEVGALEYVNGRLNFTGTTDRMVIDQSEQTETSTTTVSNTTVETTMHSHVISANEMVVGRMIEHRHLGRYTKDVSSDTFDLKVKLNGTLITTFTVPGSGATDTQLDLQMFGTCRTTGVSGTVQTYIKCQMGGINYYYFDTTPMTYDTTISHTITSKVQWGAAKVNNIVYYDQGWLTWKG